MRTLTIYLGNICNANCEYCLVDYEKEYESISIKDIKNFINTNKKEINFDQITLLGGEPTILISYDLLDYLLLNFKNIVFKTNLLNLNKLYMYMDKNISFDVSIHDNIFEQQKYNIETYINKVINFSYVVNNNNLSQLYDVVKYVHSLNKTILLTPEDDKFNRNLNDFNISLFKKQLYKIFDNNLETSLINFLKIEKKYLHKLYNISIDDKYEYCLNNNLNILPNGDLFICSHSSSFYKNYDSSRIIGNINASMIKQINKPPIKNKIMEDQLKKCLSCQKCDNYNCIDRLYSYNNYMIEDNVCMFYQTLYDFITNEYLYSVSPTKVTIFMTEKCNMKCTYCFEGDYKNKNGNISIENLKYLLDFIFKFDDNRDRVITLFGGEPTLNEIGIQFVKDYIKKLRLNGYKTHITIDINTNLLNLTDSLLNIFKEILHYASFYISLSIDGDKDSHDKHRIDLNDRGTYDKIIKNLHILRNELSKEIKNNNLCKHKLTICQHMVLMPDNIDNFDNVVKTMINNKYLFDDFSVAFPTSNRTNNFDFLTENDFIKLFNLEDKLYEQYPHEHDILNKIFYLIGYKNKTLETLNEIRICSAGYDIFSCRSNGDVITCHAFLKENETNKNHFISNVKNIEDAFKFSMNSRNYLDRKMSDLVSRNVITLQSELGYNCKECSAKLYCHQCRVSISSTNYLTINRSKEICTQTLNMWNIALDFIQKKEIKFLKNILKKVSDNNFFVYRGLEMLLNDQEKN